MKLLRFYSASSGTGSFSNTSCIFLTHVHFSRIDSNSEVGSLYGVSNAEFKKRILFCINWCQLTCSVFVDIDVGFLEPCIPCEFPFASSHFVEIPCVTKASRRLSFVNHTTRIFEKRSLWVKFLYTIWSFVDSFLTNSLLLALWRVFI